MVTKEKVLEAISQFTDIKIVTGVVVNGTKIGFALESQDEALRKSCERAVFALPGVEKVTAVLTGAGGAIVAENKGAEVLNRQQPVAGVRKIIAVAAGKGGVGKSTVSVSLALALAALGKKVGIVDADIYGPSLPRMLGLAGKPELVNNLMRPLVASNIQCNSIGFLVADADAAIWRGPMATKALHQLIRGTAWDVDVLIIDMPPGTGDIALTIAQHYPVSGAIIVTTPQEVALADVRKAATMFNRVGTPILGVIENMSYFEDAAGVKNYIFGQSGGKRFANEIGAKLLGEVPLKQHLCKNADNGQMQAEPEFVKIATYLAQSQIF